MTMQSLIHVLFLLDTSQKHRAGRLLMGMLLPHAQSPLMSPRFLLRSAMYPVGTRLT